MAKLFEDRNYPPHPGELADELGLARLKARGN
jgi:hypothetical protein